MKSLLAQCTLAAAVAAGVSAFLSISASMAQDARPGIGAQIEALGLDRAELRARLAGLSRDERIAYLQSLGVHLPEGVARPETAPGLKVLPDDRKAASGAADVAGLPVDGKFTIMPWTGSIDGGNVTVQPLPVRPRSVSSTGSVVIDPAAISGVAAFTPAQLPAKP